MLILHPSLVKFGSIVVENVVALAIERTAGREVVEWSDAGPYATYADMSERKVMATVRQTLTREDLSAIQPGDSATLVAYLAPAAVDSARRKFSATAVIAAVTVDLKTGPKDAAVRTLQFVLVSADGATDPVAMSDAEAEG